MYEFKIGDTVQTTDDRITYVISEIITDIYGTTWFRKTPGSKTDSFQKDQLKLICPAGYRPIREDEMYQYPKTGDIYLRDGDSIIYPVDATIDRFRFRDYNITKFFRPIKEERNWGWISGDNSTDECEQTEKEAKTAAENYCKRYNVETFVFKVVGKFSPKTTTEAKWNEV